MDKIKVNLNGKEVQGKKGETILQLAQRYDIDIPYLCYHKDLSLTGACRICVVEIESARTLVASCHTPIQEGMKIKTHSEKVIFARKIIVELLLSNHPDNCMVCDKANICDLRKIAADLGVGLSRFKGKRRFYPLEDENPYIKRDLTKCILCRRCIKACREIKKADVYAMGFRGFNSKVIVDWNVPLNKEVCFDCEVCINICPVGALDFKERGIRPKKECLLIKGE